MNIQQILHLTTLSVHNNMKQVRIIHFYRHTNVSQQLRNAFVQKNAMFTRDRLHFCSQFPRQSFFVVARLIKVFLLIHESPLTDALFLLASKSDEVTTT